MKTRRHRLNLEWLESRLAAGDLGWTGLSVAPPPEREKSELQLLQAVSVLQNMAARVPVDVHQPCVVPVELDSVTITGGENDGGGEVMGGGPIIRTIKASGPTIGSWTITRSHTCTTNTPLGWFARVHARSYHNMDNRPPGGTDDIHSIAGSLAVTPYVVNVTYSTRQTTRDMMPGPGKFTSQAIAMATVTAMAPPVYTWTGAGTLYGIVVNGPTGVIPGESALANVNIFDPLTIGDVRRGESFTVTFDPSGSWSYEFPTDEEAGMNYQASATISGEAASTLSGYERLFNYAIGLGNNGTITVSFSSNPLLGLNDGEIRDTILRGYSFDEGTGNWTYSGPNLTATFYATYDAGNITFSTGQDATICASAGDGDAMMASIRHRVRGELIGEGGGGCGGIGIS